MKTLSPENARRVLAMMLRIFGVVATMAIGAVFLPHSWMDAIHRGIGLGEFPDLPITGYLARSLSLFYFWLGLLAAFVSFDVGRYLPFIRFLLATGLAAGVIQTGIDVAVRMPLWWTAAEGAFLLGYFAVAIRICRRAGTASEQG